MSGIKDFEWKPELSVRVDQMDIEHKILINYFNQLIHAINAGRDIKNDFEALCKYVVQHFENEESFMEKIGFEGLNTHKVIHKSLLDKVGQYQAKIQLGDFNPEELIEFLNVWLKSHIMGIDVKYGEAVQKKAA